MFVRIRRLLLALSIALAASAGVAALATPTEAAHSQKVRTPGYKIATPSPGHVTVAALEVTVRKHGRGRPASRVRLTLPGQYSMRDSVRLFFTRRRLSGSPLRYELLFVLVNRAPGPTAAAGASTANKSSKRSKKRKRRSRRHHHVHRASGRGQYDAGTIELTVPTRTSSGTSCGNCTRYLPRTTTCKRCWFRRTTIREAQVVNADTASPTQIASLVSMLRRGFTNNGDANSVFGNPATGSPRDPTLDAGFWDDGRAFGWNQASLADTAPIDHGVVDDILSGQLTKIIPDLEISAQADLNGNGRLDAATTPGGGAGV